jgi:hypothetical protein
VPNAAGGVNPKVVRKESRCTLSDTTTSSETKPLGLAERRPPEKEQPTEPAVAQALINAASTLHAAKESRWRVQIDAPRWAMVRNGHESGLAAWLFFAALVWASLGVGFAWHLSDQIASHPGLTPPLSEQLGLWAAVVVVIGGAVVAGITAFRSAKLHVNMALEPSAKAEAALKGEDNGAGAKTNAPSSAAPPLSGSTTNGSSPSPTAQPDAKIVDPRTTLSPKVVAGSASALASAAFWTIAAATFWHKVEPTILAALGTGLTTVTGAIAAWWKTDPLRISRIIQSHPTE